MENGDKRVCVYMQVYRNEAAIHTAIKSVLDQTYKNIRFCILVSSETKQVVQKYAEKDSRIEVYDRIIGESNIDYCVRRNRILQQGNDEYFTSIDADDWYDEHYIEELLSFALMNHTDITACGNYFVNALGEQIGVRNQCSMFWDTIRTAEVLPQIYAFFRTVWGKLISSKLMISQKIEELPHSDTYGAYGGDTLYMFNLLQHSQKLGICSKPLYYYRISPASSSYHLKEGRLDSDSLLFNYVRGILNQWGPVGETQERFLYQVYGNAVKDTTSLVKNQKISEESKTKKLLYIYTNYLTGKLLQREYCGQLALSGQDMTDFAHEMYDLIFYNVKRRELTELARQNYLELFERIFHQWAGKFTAAEFSVLLSDKEMLDALIAEQYEKLFICLIEFLKKAKSSEIENCLLLLRKTTKTIVLSPVLIEQKFVLKYSDLVNKINRLKDEEVFLKFGGLFQGEKLPYQAKLLAELWMNFAASRGNIEQFVQGKLCLAIVLLQEDDLEQAKFHYEELEDLGISGEAMACLHEQLYQ